MKKLIVLLLTVCILTACQRADFYPNGTIVDVEGASILVHPVGPSSNTYRALTNVGGLSEAVGEAFTINANRYQRNVRAIEIVTSCSVNRDTIVNFENTTTAAVRC